MLQQANGYSYCEKLFLRTHPAAGEEYKTWVENTFRFRNFSWGWEHDLQSVGSE